MDHLPLVLMILAVDWLAMVTPGPNFLLVTQAAMRRSRRYAGFSALGIATGSLVWCLIAAFGLAAVFAAVPFLAAFLRLAGAAYLVYLGVALWRGAGPIGADEREPAPSAWRGYRRGLLVNMTNPKSAAYYGSVFAAFMVPGLPSWLQATVIALIAAGSVVWHLTLALLLSTRGARRVYAAATRPLGRAAERSWSPWEPAWRSCGIEGMAGIALPTAPPPDVAADHAAARIFAFGIVPPSRRAPAAAPRRDAT
jgi:threonine efflux protein